MNYKININRQKLSEKEVQSKMNFNGFMQGYQAAGTISGSFLSGIKYLTIVGASGIVLLGGYLAYKGFSGSGSSSGNGPFVDPPVVGAGVPLSAFSIDPKRDTAVVYNTGSSIIIPAQAFLDEKGKPVEGHVELRYREFHDPFEVMLSGIPMHYDSAGERYQFESAGMVEVLAFKDGQPLFTNPDAPIRINMLSRNNEEKFNLYYLDTVNKRWEYKEKNCQAKGNMKPLYDGEMGKKYLQEAVKQLEQQMPERANPGRQSFVIDYNKDEFPELAMFSDVKFEVDKNDRSYNAGLAKKQWQDVSISMADDKKQYNITFSNETESHTFSVKPVLEGLKYEDVKREMESKLIDYQMALQKGKLEKRQSNEVLMANYRQAVQTAEWDNINGYVKEYLEVDRVNYVQLSARSFNATVFGVWNLDIPLSVRMRYQSFTARFTDVKGKEVDLKSAWVIEPEKNMIVYFRMERGLDVQSLRHDPNSRTVLVALTTSEEFFYIKEVGFRKAMKKGEGATFALTAANKKIKDPNELKTLLGF